ncbi:hypothetical protein DH2020_012511 [Rehmannia glutinosa]|uniref:DUF4378 domain-containing protein n=1 Tax=Rehmannia glutinosa TaxID=99300 RepID=A0ABR0WZK6_REHGL
MNDTLEKTVSSLAVVEKKPQRPGGCVGIFFQLFDWNRRLAKKKLFSKKLLPPVRLKQASKKFGGDEKQPKLRLIADENSGGFPTTKNNNGSNNADIDKQHEMRAPGLVARLMGLESMPALQRDKSKKAPSSNYARGKTDKFVDNVNGYSKEELNVEKGGIKNELRPQKLQKTNVCERQPITRFGAEKLPFKSVLSKSRKHHPKLPSPVRSPRNISRKSSSKLIGAASRILEPGFQTGRSKCAITYSNTLHHPPQDTVMDERAQSSCRNCGYLSDNLESKRDVIEKPLIFVALLELHRIVLSRVGKNGRIERYSSSQHCKPPKGVPLCLNLNHKSQSQIQMSNNVDGRKNFVSVNQSLSGSTRSRFPARMDNGKFESEKRISNSLNDSVPPGRKRRPPNVSRQAENVGFISSTINKRGFGSPQYNNVHFVNHLQERTVDNGRVDKNVVSFTFNSPVKQKNGIQEVAERRNRNGLRCDDSLQKPALGENGMRMKFEKPLPLSGDALGALLQQKLKELTCEGEDMGINASKKTTSTILQELISALTSEKPLQQYNLPVISDKRKNWFNDSQLSNSTSSTSSQANTMAVKVSVDQPLDSERPSPGSVLEAYFSTESCHSSNLDDSPGCKMLTETVDCSYSRPRSPNPDSDPFDSAASMNNRANSSKESVINILNHVSEIICCNTFANCGLKGDKFDQAKDILSNAELVLHNAALTGPVVGKGCPIKHLLLDELETLASVLWMNFGSSLGVEDGKEANQLRRFVLDSIIEYLDVRFGRFPKASRKLPLRTNANTLIFEIVEVIRRWEELSRYSLDELIEREMSFSLREWTECENEAFESGMEISRYLLQILVDEIVMDL